MVGDGPPITKKIEARCTQDVSMRKGLVDEALRRRQRVCKSHPLRGPSVVDDRV